MPFFGLLTVGLIGAGTQIAGAVIGSKSAKSAAKQQVEAANQAKADLQPIYQENVARLNPYANLGSSAVGSLSSLMGYPPAPPPTGYGVDGKPLGPITGTQGPMNMSDPRVQQLAKGASLVDVSSGGRGFAGSPTGTAVPRTASSYAPLSSLSTGRTVRMLAPSGEQANIPLELVAKAEARGARRV